MYAIGYIKKLSTYILSCSLVARPKNVQIDSVDNIIEYQDEICMYVYRVICTRKLEVAILTGPGTGSERTTFPIDNN